MNKFDFLIQSFNDRAYTKKSFLLSIFSKVLKDDYSKLKEIPYAVFYNEDEKPFFYKENEQIFIEDYELNKPLFNKNDPFFLKAGQVPWIKEETETTVGRFLFNMVVLLESFKGKVDYMNHQVTKSTLEELIKDLMVDNPKEGEVIPLDKASVDECLKVSKQLDYLVGLNPILVKSSSIEMFTINPDIIKLRDELLDGLEKEGKLDDEIEVGKVIDILVAKDAELQYGGVNRDFYIKHDFIANSRKKMFIVFDMLPDFHTGKYQLLRNSLEEGWEFNKENLYINTAISGSYDRGVSTAKGGTEVKIAILLTSHIKVDENDCKTKRTELANINEKNFNGWIKGYHLVDGNLTLIAKEDKNKYIGKSLEMRVPQYCKAPDNNICKYCCGESLGAVGSRLSSEVTGIFSAYMLTSMKIVHLSKLVTVDVPLEESIR